MISILELLLDLIYPNVCGFCERIDEECLCEECEKRLNEVLTYKIRDIQDKYFEKHIYLGKYDGEFRNSILSYKFLEQSYMYKTFAKLILKNEKICGIIRKL